MAELFQDWMARAGATDRVPPGWEAPMKDDPHGQVLCRAGLEYVRRFEFAVAQTWTVETLTGFVYSTCFLNREALGDKVPAFQRDLAERLLIWQPDGAFEVRASYAYELARRPVDLA
jgi:hypothetical protein